MISKDFHEVMNGVHKQGFDRKGMSIVRKMAYLKEKERFDWILHSY